MLLWRGSLWRAVDDGDSAVRRLGGVLSHTSAALRWGWSVWRQPREPWVTIPQHGSVDSSRRRGVRLVRQDVVIDGVVIAPIQTVLDCARRLPFEEALPVADSALRSGAVCQSELSETVGRLPRPGPASSRLIRLSDGRADNPFESVVRASATENP